MVILDNKILYVEIDTLGAEIKKIIYNGENRLWNGDSKYWTGTSPIIFPICGRPAGGKITYKNKDYQMDNHGFAKRMEFTVESSTTLSAVFLLTDSEETLKHYPWHFELRAIYTLEGSTIKVEYIINNTSDDTMYMSIGSHEAYACPEGIEDYDIIFDKNETLLSYDVEESMLSYNRSVIIKDTNTLPLYYKYFNIDSLVFKDVKSHSLKLRNRKTGKSVDVDFNGFDYLLLWTIPKAGFICIEPWTGAPPMIGSSSDITEKEGITSIGSGKSLYKVHKICF